MPRVNRGNLGDGIFHVTARGNRRQEIFTAERDYFMYLSLLSRTVKREGWCCVGFCLMPNHVHLVLECSNEALSSGMHHLQGTYANWFNTQQRVDGHLFQGRYGSRLVGDQEHWLEVVRYVVLNPVRAGLCADVGDWHWSSFSATAGTAPLPAFLSAARVLEEFSPNETLARRSYETFVRQGVGACPGTHLGGVAAGSAVS
jgi:REP element-mobilizing transposase RayT